MRKAHVYKARGYGFAYNHPWLCALPDGRLIQTATWRDAMTVAWQEIRKQ